VIATTNFLSASAVPTPTSISSHTENGVASATVIVVSPAEASADNSE